MEKFWMVVDGVGLPVSDDNGEDIMICASREEAERVAGVEADCHGGESYYVMETVAHVVAEVAPAEVTVLE